jgi:hypothetical protein
MWLWLYPGSNSQNLIITSHGEFKNGDMFNTPCELLFYSDHGIIAPGTAFASASASIGGTNDAVRETVHSGSQSYNYLLTKFQGRHKDLTQGTEETYGGLQNAQGITNNWNQIPQVAAQDNPRLPTYDDYDILTMRNRWSGHGVDLHSAIVLARRYKPYSRIHCSFCRK